MCVCVCVRVCLSYSYMYMYTHVQHYNVHVYMYNIYCTCIHILYMYTCTIHFILQNWTKLNKSGGGPWPEERSRHAAVCLSYGQQYPQLLVTGGWDRQDKPLADVWILDIESGSWRKVRLEYTQLCKTYPNIFSGYTDRVMKWLLNLLCACSTTVERIL